MHKSFILLIVSTFLSTGIWAQSFNVKGTVTDTDGTPLRGVSVSEKENQTVVLTDQQGKYTIQVKNDQSVLEFVHVGYKSHEESINKRNTIDVKLEADVKSMDEVVVVGYGSVKRRDLTGSLSSVSGSELSKIPALDVASTLAGRAAGVQVTTSQGQPGSGISIKIRGGGSITQSNEPLYVVDGFQQTDGLRDLDPTDIESIEILKDASATAIYGARGANGVVLVTTKQAKASQRSVVTYDMFYGNKFVNGNIPMLKPYDYVLLEYERSLGSEPDIQRFHNRYGTFDQIESLYLGRQGVNWQSELFGETAHTQYHKIGLNGGNDQTKLNLFYSVNNDDGIMVNSGASKNVVKLNVNHRANQKLRLNATTTYTSQKIWGIGTSEGENRFNKLQNILQFRPTMGVMGNDDDLVKLDEDPALADDAGNVMQNPYVNAIAETRESKINTLNLNGSVSYEFTKHLTYRGVVGYRINLVEALLFNGSRSINAKRTSGPNGSVRNAVQNSYNYSNTLTYKNKFNRIHNVEFMLGQEENFRSNKYVEVSAGGFPNDDIGLNDLSQGTLPGIPLSSLEDERMLSFFGRANYSLSNKYLLTATLRSDGSSKFGSGNKFGYFPSVAFAWRAIDENFLKQVEFLSDLKLRVSYGSVGNNRINNYLSLAMLQSGYYPLNNTPSISVGARTLPNPNLKWETTNSANIGLDIGLVNHRIQLTVDAYINRTKDLLLNTEVPYTSGYGTMQKNIGSTENKGVEFSLNTINIEKGPINWTSSFNISFNKNKIIALADGQEYFYANSGYQLSESDYIIKVGEAVGKMYGYRSDGLYQVTDFNYDPNTQQYTLKEGLAYDPNNIPQPGFRKLVDTNDDGKINSDDRVIIGDANPRFFGGLNNTFSYKGLDLGIFLSFSVGNDIYNANKLINTQTHLAYRNAYEYVNDRWTTLDHFGNRVTDPVLLAELNEGKTIPSYLEGKSVKFYDDIVEDGSFLRISNINIGYTLPKSFMKNVIHSMRVHLTASNIHTFTKYSGYDPEVSTRNASGVTPGIDFGAYPRSRSFVLGANVTF